MLALVATDRETAMNDVRSGGELKRSWMSITGRTDVGTSPDQPFRAKGQKAPNRIEQSLAAEFKSGTQARTLLANAVAAASPSCPMV